MGGVWLGIGNGKYVVRIWGVANLIEVNKPRTNEWTHIAVCRKNDKISLYFNGVLQGEVTNNNIFPEGMLAIGMENSGGPGSFSKKIYIDEVRILNGIAEWDENFDIPSHEYNYINGTKEQETKTYLAFLDHLNEIPTDKIAGDAYIVNSNTMKTKFGNSSAYLNNEYISYPSNEKFRLDGDFTVDYWVYELDNNADEWNTHMHISSINDGCRGIWLGLNYGKYVVRISGVGNLIEVNKPSNNEWIHIAVCRKNNIISLYFNGILQSEVECNHIFEEGILYVGANSPNTFYSKKIFIDELRILNGIAEWDENFTPNIKPYRY